MAITAQQVKSLRDKTGAGMMDCKKALTESGGDEEQAVVWLREKGLAKAKKRADRATSEGLIGLQVEGGLAVMVEVMCETDFVAKSDKFQDFVNNAVKAVVAEDIKDGDELLTKSVEGGKTLNDELNELVAVLGENIQVGKIVRLPLEGPGGFGSYVHSNGKIGVLVEFGAPENLDSPEFEELGKDVAMQIAALSPVCVCEEEVPAELVEREKEIYKSQAMEEGKPEQIAEKIVEGRIKKYYKEICLVDQPFVKDDKQCVGDLLKNFGPDVTIRRFVRMELGAQAN